MVRSRTGNVNQYFFTQTDTQTFFSSATQIYIYIYRISSKERSFKFRAFRGALIQGGAH